MPGWITSLYRSSCRSSYGKTPVEPVAGRYYDDLGTYLGKTSNDGSDKRYLFRDFDSEIWRTGQHVHKALRKIEV